MSLRTTLPFLWNHPLARRRRARTLGRWLRWQLASRLLGWPVVMPWVNGTRLLVQRGMTGATGNLYCGLHEWPDMAFLLHCLRPGDIFLDGGANVGSYTVLAAGAIGAEVIAVEPIPSALNGLHNNIALNRLQDRVQVVEACLGARRGEIMFSDDMDTMNRCVQPGYAGHSRTVPMLRLDDLERAFECCLWKLDVEGMEPDVLAGADAALASTAVRAVLMEGRQPAVIDRMEQGGFQPCSYDPWNRRMTYQEFTPTSNQLWIRDHKWVQDRLETSANVLIFEQWV